MAAALDPEAEWLLSRAWLQEGNLKEAGAALERAGTYRAENPLVPEPSPYVGAASCVSCHREESRDHEKSRHARTFHHGRGLLDLPFPDRPLADPDDPKVTHNFKRENDKIKVETRAGDKIYQIDRRVCLRDQRPVRDDDRPRRGTKLSRSAGSRRITPRKASAWGRTVG